MRIPWTRQSQSHSEDAELPPVEGHQWTMGDQLVSVATVTALWLAVALGPVGFGLAVWQLGRPAEAPAAISGLAVVEQEEQLRASEFAVRAVSVWLGASRGQEALVRGLMPSVTGQMLPQIGLQVTNPMVAACVDAGDGIWSVTVAATVTDSRMTARRFFALPVQVGDQTVSAVSLPREVPSTQLAAAAPESDYPTPVRPDSALVRTASEFLLAYLAGKGDVARLAAPQSSIRAVLPAPFVTVQVSGVAAHSEIPEAAPEGAQLEVLVTASGQVNEQQFLTVQYPLTLAVRAGRWEVTQVRNSPLIASKQPSSSPSQPPAVTASLAPSNSLSTPSTQK